MKIAVIGPLELPKPQGGVTRHCEEIYARIAESDEHEVTVLCAGGPAPDVSYRGMRIRKLRTARSPGWERITYALAAALAATCAATSTSCTSTPSLVGVLHAAQAAGAEDRHHRGPCRVAGRRSGAG